MLNAIVLSFIQENSMGTNIQTGLKGKTVSVIGGGFVGQVIKRYYPDAKVYDINGKHDSREEVLKADVIFIAFNLLDNGRQSIKAISEYATDAPQGRLFIIKSTFVPGVTDTLQAVHDEHTFIYNPEFLTEMTAWDDFATPRAQILGCPHKALDLVHELFEFLPKAPLNRVISPTDAELLKHATNAYYSTKVTFFNQLYDAAQELNADYETVKEIMSKDKWIGDSHNVIFHKGYRGYGGKCLPKDTNALRKLVNFPLLDNISEYNAKLRSE